MAQHTHDVYDTGKYFEINGISRFIKETSDTKLVLVQGDHNSEVITFQMPRYIDGHDMLLCNKIRVHYINLDTKTNDKSADIYEVTDLALCEECEDETLTFTWKIEAPATKYSGSLAFLIKFECTEGENILYQWSTAKYVSVNVLAGIDNSEEFVEKYSNVLEEWYNELTKGADSIEELNQQAIAEIELAKEDAKEDIQGKADATMAEMNQFSSNAYNSFQSNVNKKASETLASIPEEYSDMDAEVKDLRSILVHEYNDRGSFLTVDDDGSTIIEKVFDKYATGYAKNLLTDYTIGVQIDGRENTYYMTSDFIKIVKGVPYCASRKTTSVYTYDNSKKLLARTGVTLDTAGIVFNDNVAYIRAEFFYQSAYTYAIHMGEKYISKYPDSYAPEYSVNESFSKMLDTQVSKRLKRNAVREFGRYGGDIELNQYTRIFNVTKTATKIERINITDDSDWYGYGVRQIAKLTHIDGSTAQLDFWFSNQDGTQYLVPSTHNFEVGDIMYIGFMCRTYKEMVMDVATENTRSQITDYEPLVFGTVPHFHEYAIPITEENINKSIVVDFKFGTSNDAWVEISNLYISNESNTNKCIFEDLARKEVMDKIISDKFQDKTWLALGDSITQQGNYITSLKSYMPFGTIDNQGIGGSTIINTYGASGCLLIDTLEENVKSADVITIAYGTNDSNYIKNKSTWSVGELSDYGSEFDLTTFYGAYQYVIEKILSWNPTVKIVPIVPAWSMIVDSDTMTKAEIRELKDAVAQAVRDVANYYGYKYIDLYYDSGMNEFNRLTYAPDDVHPTSTFGDITARLMIPVFETLKV